MRELTVEQKVKLGTITSPAEHSRARHASVRPMSQLEMQSGAGWSRTAAARDSSNPVYLAKLDNRRLANRSATTSEKRSIGGRWGRVIGIEAVGPPSMPPPFIIRGRFRLRSPDSLQPPGRGRWPGCTR